MNRSNPSTLAGGVEMNRDTSPVVSSSKSAGASERRNSRRVKLAVCRSGRPLRQPSLTTEAYRGPTVGDVEFFSSSGWKGIMLIPIPPS
jgi:hypothetical protein